MFRSLLEKWLIGNGALAGYVRHGLTFVAGVLVATGYVSVENAGSLVDVLVAILTSPQMIAGVGVFVAGKAASTVNKQDTKQELKDVNKELVDVTKDLKNANKELDKR